MVRKYLTCHRGRLQYISLAHVVCNKLYIIIIIMHYRRHTLNMLYLQVQQARQKRRVPTKREKDSVMKALKERDSLVKQLESHDC